MARWTFTPNCMTSDGTRFYGHTTYSFTSGSEERTIVLAKSNVNPASFNDVTWTVVATAKESDFGYLSGMNILRSILCTVDKQGVFTIIASTMKKSSSDPENLPQGGYQFTPNADGSSGGNWSKISMTEPYPWNVIGRASLTSVPSPNGGKDVVAHVFASSNIADIISVGILDPVSKTFTIKSNWTLPVAGYPYYIEAQGDKVGVLSLLFPGGNTPVYQFLPLAPTGVQPANASVTTLNFTLPTGCSSLISSPSNVNYLVSTDGKKNSEAIRTGYAKTYNDIYPIGPPGGAAVWGMMTNFSDYSGVVLSGANTGAYQAIPQKMSLDGLSGNGNIRGDNIGGGGGGGGGIENLSTGAIAGIVAGVLLCVISSSSICRILNKRGKHHIAYNRPVTPVPEDPDASVPNIDEVPEAKVECDILPMAPNAPTVLPSGTGAGVGSGKGPATSSILPPPTFASRPPLDTTLAQVAAQQPQPQPQFQPSLSSPLAATQNTYEDGYQQGFQQALLALRNEQKQQQQQAQQRQPQNPQLVTNTLPLADPQAATSALPPTTFNNTTTTAMPTVATNHPQHYAQPNNPQYYAQSNSPQYYEQQPSVGYHQIGATYDSFRNPQDYSIGMPQSSPFVPGSTPVSPLPAYNSGSATTMSPVPSYGTGPSSGNSTPYTPSSGVATQAWTPGLTFSGTMPGHQQNQRPGNQGSNPSAGGHDHQGTADANESNDAPVLTLPAHLYSKLTDAHCHIQDDRESIRTLVESWSNSTTPSDESSPSATPLLAGKVCLMGVQPSKDLGLEQGSTSAASNSNDKLAGIEANTASLSLNSNSLSSSSTPIVTVSWSDTDVHGDWDLVAKLAETHPDRFVPCFGIHPWFTHKYKPLEGGYKGSTFELRGVSNTNSNNASGASDSSTSGAIAGTGTGGAAGAGPSSTSPSLSFSSAFLTPVPGPGVRREAFLAMSKQLQEQMAKESREREGFTQEEQKEEANTEATSNKHAADATTMSAQEAPTEKEERDATTTPINVTIPNADDARFSHYKTVLSLPTSATESYLADLAKRLPTPRALEPALKELRRQLEAHPHAVLGEIGLDRTARVPEPSFVPSSSTPEETITTSGAGEESTTPTTTSAAPQKRITLALTSIQHQLDIVREQLKLAAALDRPVSFHCVQAYGHWHDFLIQEGRRLRQLEADQEYQIQLQQIQASGGTIPLLPPTAMSPTGMRLSKRSTARLKREARDAAWERHVASTLRESSDEEDDSDEAEDQDDSDEERQQKKAKAKSAAASKEVHFNESTTAADSTGTPTPATAAIPQPAYEPVLPPRLCMHSYGGSVDMLKAFTKLDHPPEIYFSFSILINGRLQERKLKELILAVPEDRLLIESDHHSHNHVDQLLVEMALKVAEIRKWTVEETVERTARNWQRFVYGDNHPHD
ncbi:hypothetical protein BGW39_006606 [Mortierella sp. 14UC]|nr:hypothetical protein BGW39_006606 [Mortierella sp. 14UC]